MARDTMGLTILKRRGVMFQKRRTLVRRGERLGTMLGIFPQCELVVVLTDNNEMTNLNTTYRGRRRTTDVLAFSQLEGPAGSLHPEILGDVVISVPTAIRQAKQRRSSVLDEVTELLVHGVLHLIGYDHEGAGRAAAAQMRKKQRELVANLVANRGSFIQGN
jgi:probable rRNA maturation factor